MFDWEHGIALHPMQGNCSSSRVFGEVSWFFSSCCSNLGYILALGGWPFETRVCSTMKGLLSSYDSQLKNLNYAWQDSTNTSGAATGDQASLSSWQSDIGIPINFQEESGIVTFRSIELSWPLEVSRDVRPCVLMRGDLGLSLGTAQ